MTTTDAATDAAVNATTDATTTAAAHPTTATGRRAIRPRRSTS
jgi:hypothetical protein